MVRNNKKAQKETHRRAEERTGDKHVMTVSRVLPELTPPCYCVIVAAAPLFDYTYTWHVCCPSKHCSLTVTKDVPRELIDWALKSGSRKMRDINQYLFLIFPHTQRPSFYCFLCDICPISPPLYISAPSSLNIKNNRASMLCTHHYGIKAVFPCQTKAHLSCIR